MNRLINSTLITLIEDLLKEENLILSDRKKELLTLAKLCNSTLKEDNQLKFNVICTHNSRRSQLGQLWLRTAAVFFNINNVYTYSGGTEATAFNINMVNAIQSVGFQIEQLNNFENPKYQIQLSEFDNDKTLYYSKIYDESYNPQANYIAILVCNSAAETCPNVTGAKHRFVLPYNDPKTFDETNLEKKAYIDTVNEIGREVLFMMNQIKK